MSKMPSKRHDENETLTEEIKMFNLSAKVKWYGTRRCFERKIVATGTKQVVGENHEL